MESRYSLEEKKEGGFCKSNEASTPVFKWQTLGEAELQPNEIKRSIKCAALASLELVAYLKIICCSERLCNIVPPSSGRSLIIKSEQRLLGSRNTLKVPREKLNATFFFLWLAVLALPFPFCLLSPFTCLLCSLLKVEQTRTSTPNTSGGWRATTWKRPTDGREAKGHKGHPGSGLTCDWGAQMANTTLLPARLVMPRPLFCAKSRTREAWTLTDVIRCCWRSLNKARITQGQHFLYENKPVKLWECGDPIL